MRRPHIGRLFAVLLTLLLVGTMPARAHDPGLSLAELTLRDGTLAASVTFARAEPVPADALPILEVEIDGRRVEPRGARSEDVLGDAARHTMEFEIGEGADLTVRAPVLASLARGHRQYLSIRRSDGSLLAERMLRVEDTTLTISLRTTASAGSFGSFFVLGVHHILEGYDHLLFLLGLLIVGGSFRSVAGIVTAFTAAHSITLGAATLGLVHVPGRIIEPLIAASIVYVGVENLLRRETDHRWLLALGFGLIHGFGFASVLAELGIGTGLRATGPLLAFNLGVEAGQLAVAALALPLIWRLARSPRLAPRYVPACSLLVAAAGGYWLVERLLEG